MKGSPSAVRRLYVAGLWLNGLSTRQIVSFLRRARVADVSIKTVQDDLEHVRRPWTDATYYQQLRDLRTGAPARDTKRRK